MHESSASEPRGTGWRRRGRRAGWILAGLAALAALLISACDDGDDDASADDAARPRVVATTPILREFAERVAGGDASVNGIIPPGVDLHSFQPSTGVARDVAEADLLIVNGYNAEEGLIAVVLENRRRDTPIVVAAAGLDALEGGHDDDDAHDDDDDDAHDDDDDEHDDDDDAHGDEDEHDDHDEVELPNDVSELVIADGDPHFWLDVANAIGYVENIRDALVAIDPEHADGYESRGDAYVAELRALDTEVRDAVAGIAAERRGLVVFHDAYQYFAGAYGLELIATVLPSSAGQEPSAADVAEVVEAVRDGAIPAIYAEPQFDAGVLELIAGETGARLLTIYSVPLGTGAGADSYAAMMRANADALVDGLGGG